MKEYPFRFYGSQPMDWFEGANMGHHYELEFREEPDADKKRMIGEAWGLGTFAGVIDPGEWLWCGRWALATVGERRSRDHGAFFRKIAVLLRDVHSVHPLEQVVFWGARGDTDHAWERETLGDQPTPNAGPSWPGLAPQSWYRQARDLKVVQAAVDRDFAYGFTDGQTMAAEKADVAKAKTADATSTPAPANATIATSLDAAVKRVETFLGEYMHGEQFFNDGEAILWMQYTSANAERTGIHVLFCTVEDPEDSERLAACEGAINAAREANPKLGYEITWELSD